MIRQHYIWFEEQFGHLWKPYYQEPHRYYHIEHHIHRMVLSAEEQNQILTLPQAIAVMFHDAVYIPGYSKNEERSVDIMNAVLYNSTLVTKDDLYVARDCIMSTVNHSPLCHEAELIIDLDLVELATNYDRNSQLIRNEFRPFYTPGEYRNGRIAFLTSMLNKKQLFYTPNFRKYEKPARLNMEKSLEILKETGTK